MNDQLRDRNYTSLSGLFISYNSNYCQPGSDALILIHPIKIEFKADVIYKATLDKDLQLNIFRIVQEQLNNIIKHSKATHDTIHLTLQKNDILLLISDNGVGCETKKKEKGVGMINIRSRTELCHGTLTIISPPDKDLD